MVKVLKRKYVILAAVLLIAIIATSLILTYNTLTVKTPTKQFFVGVEFAYGNQFSQLKTLVDKVKAYTNLFVMGSVGLSFNKTSLDQSCDYIYASGLYFIVLFTNFQLYNSTGFTLNSYTNYTIFDWMKAAKQKYGSRFLGIYRYDEPGGNQLDNGPSRITFSKTNYSDVADNYVYNLKSIVTYYLDHGAPRLFTSDYGLYWFDYQSAYNCVFAEFLGNQNRSQTIALDRGAAQSFNKDWGVIITTFGQKPYLESGDDLYADLTLAYNNGAKYAIVFSSPDVTTYGTLTQTHFEALQKLWTYINLNQSMYQSIRAQVAYVIPQDYGFGFRGPNDTIWGLFPPDNLSSKIYYDTGYLTGKYDDMLNVICDNQAVIGSTLNKYTTVFYWNQTII